ncbi:MAG: hypothetical protein LBK69_01460 [Syntrophomonadaceae bacterium]|jgi:hypothetical protein|nr:hypothetical protein [Syntrophomonadaceae bacterium]
MSPVKQQIIDILDMLPEQEQDLAYEVLRRIVLAWDPDFTKLTPAEAEHLKIGKQQLASGNFYDDTDIDWDNLDDMDLN